jgi:hypothetical protein
MRMFDEEFIYLEWFVLQIESNKKSILWFGSKWEHKKKGITMYVQNLFISIFITLIDNLLFILALWISRH